MKLLAVLFGILYFVSSEKIEKVTQWTGPWADTIQSFRGNHLVDTPEVEKAKQEHLRAHEEALRILNLFDPKQNFFTQASSKDSPITFLTKMIDPVNGQYFYHYPNYISTFVPIGENAARNDSDSLVVVQTDPKRIYKYAEEIPRSPTGETPEVYAARMAHLRAIVEAHQLAAAFQTVDKDDTSAETVKAVNYESVPEISQNYPPKFIYLRGRALNAVPFSAAAEEVVTTEAVTVTKESSETTEAPITTTEVIIETTTEVIAEVDAVSEESSQAAAGVEAAPEVKGAEQNQTSVRDEIIKTLSQLTDLVL